MNKKIVNTSTAFTVVGVINTIVYIVLMCMNIVPFFMTKTFAFLMIALFLFAVWAPVIINRIFKINFSLPLVIAYDTFLVMGVLVGTLWEVYKMSLVFDKIVHFSSGILIALFAYELFTAGNKRKLSPVWTFALVFSMTMMIGGVWEIWEFTFDVLFEQNSQSWMGFVGHEVLLDTMLDMICDCAGGILGGLYAALTEWNKVRVKVAKPRQVIDVEGAVGAQQ